MTRYKFFHIIWTKRQLAFTFIIKKIKNKILYFPQDKILKNPKSSRAKEMKKIDRTQEGEKLTLKPF